MFRIATLLLLWFHPWLSVGYLKRLSDNTAYYMPTPLWPKPQSFKHGNLTCILDQNQINWKLSGNASNSKILQNAIQNTINIIFAWTSNNTQHHNHNQNRLIRTQYNPHISSDNTIHNHQRKIQQTQSRLAKQQQPSPLDNNINIDEISDILSTIESSQYLQTVIISTDSNSEVLNSNMIENYTLSMKNNCTSIKITAPQIWGAIRALESITQLVYYNQTLSLYLLNRAPWIINDFPRFQHRGILIDAGLHFISKSAVKRTIGGLSYNKMNVLHWHATEAASMPLESKLFPDLATKGAYASNAIYTQDDMLEIVQYGKERGVRVIIELDVPGHSYAWGIGYPDLLAYCPQMYPLEINYWHSAFDPTKNYTYNFLESFMTEMFGIFEDDIIHLGGDEVVAFSWNCWNESEPIQEYMKLNNVSLVDLYAMFETRVHTFAAKFDRSVITWDEVFCTVPNSIPDTAIVQIWRQNGTLFDVLKSGRRAIQSSQYYLNLGFDYGQTYVKAWDIYRLNPLSDEDIEYYNLTNDDVNRFLGCEACIWGEDVDEYNIDQRLWFRASVFAERMWTLDKNIDDVNLNDTTRRVIQHRCRLLQRGLRPSAYEDDDDHPFPMRNWNQQCQLNIPPYVPDY